MHHLAQGSPFYFATEEDMQTFGYQLAKSLPDRVLVTLSGELGSGKSVLVRAIIQSLGYTGRIKSPTYTLIETYQIAQQDGNSKTVSHLDLYRLADPAELHYLAFDDVLQGSDWVFIEWPEQAEGYLPKADLHLALSYEKNGRQVIASLAS